MTSLHCLNTFSLDFPDCDSDEFKCDNGDCVDEDYECDGTDDCGDNSDEEGCGRLKCFYQ